MQQTIRKSFAPEFLTSLPSNIKVKEKSVQRKKTSRISKYAKLHETLDQMPIGGWVQIAGTDEINKYFGFWTTERKGIAVPEDQLISLNVKNITNYFTLQLKPKDALGKATGESPYKDTYELVVAEEADEEGNVYETLWLNKLSEPATDAESTDE